MLPVTADKYVSFLGSSTHLENMRPKSAPRPQDWQPVEPIRKSCYMVFILTRTTYSRGRFRDSHEANNKTRRKSIHNNDCINNMMNNKKRMFRLGPLRSLCQDVRCFVLGQRNNLSGNPLFHPHSSQLSAFFSYYLIRCCFVPLGRKSFL